MCLCKLHEGFAGSSLGLPDSNHRELVSKRWGTRQEVISASHQQLQNTQSLTPSKTYTNQQARLDQTDRKTTEDTVETTQTYKNQEEHVCFELECFTSKRKK
ncbi:UNVERIFIED_CONTAM: hypothetical protein FKN15_003762 [Acipenser sinensis]